MWTDEDGEPIAFIVNPKPYKKAHFATFPPALIEPCILAGSPVGGTVLDPFAGAGTTGLVSLRNGRGFVGIELKPEYVEIAKRRIEYWQNVKDAEGKHKPGLRVA